MGCLEREDYKLFKLNRMDCVVETDRGFLRRDVPILDLSKEKIFTDGIKVKALFSRLYGYGKPCDMAYDIWSKSRGA